MQLDEVLPAVKEAIGEDGIALVTIHQMAIAERIADHIVISRKGASHRRSSRAPSRRQR